MRALVVLAAGLVVLTMAPAGAADTGVIEGVVIDGSTEEPVEGAEVTLTIGRAGGDTEAISETTGNDGSFRFPDLATGDDVIYALDAIYEGGLFTGRALTIPSDTEEQPVIDTKLRVWETTTDPEVIIVARNDLFVTEGRDGQAGVIESYQLTNTSDRAYIGRGGGGQDSPSLGFALPEGAQAESVQVIDSALDLPGLVRTDFGFGITTAIPPGSFAITFGYAVPGTAAAFDLSRRMLYPTLNFAIFASDKLDVDTNRLDEKDTVDIEGVTYREHSTDEPLDAGDSVQAIALADAGTPPGLIAGMAGALLLVAALGAYPVWRSRRDRAKEEQPGETREDLIAAIAELDLKHERGEMDAETWARSRAELKARVGETTGAQR